MLQIYKMLKVLQICRIRFRILTEIQRLMQFQECPMTRRSKHDILTGLTGSEFMKKELQIPHALRLSETKFFLIRNYVHHDKLFHASRLKKYYNKYKRITKLRRRLRTKCYWKNKNNSLSGSPHTTTYFLLMLCSKAKK